MSRNADDRSRSGRRVLRRALAIGVLATIGWFASAFAATPVAAALTAPVTVPAPTNATCAVTGYSARDGVAVDKLVAQLGKQTAFQLGGTPLTPGGVWTVPAGQVAVLVVDHEQPSTTYREQLTIAGVHTWSAAGAATGHRWITGKLPSAQSWTRTIGVSADVANCRVAITMTTSHGPLGTQVGGIGAALLVICGFLLLFVGRGKSRVVSTLAAIPFGIVAGVGLSAVLYESGRLDPYGHGVLVAPVVGLVIAVTLPWTRRAQAAAAIGDRTVGDNTVDRAGYVPVGASTASTASSTSSARSEVNPGDGTGPSGASMSTASLTQADVSDTDPAPGAPAAVGDTLSTARSGPRSGRAIRVVAAAVAAVVCAGAAGGIIASRPRNAAAGAAINPAAAAVIVAAWHRRHALPGTHRELIAAGHRDHSSIR